MIIFSIGGNVLRTKNGVDFEGQNISLVQRLNATPYFQKYPSVVPDKPWATWIEIRKEFKGDVKLIDHTPIKQNYNPEKIY